MGEGLLLLLVVLVIANSSKSKMPAASGPAQLVPGAAYRATIKLTGLEATFGKSSDVKEQLDKAGFRDVVVTAKGGGVFEATGKWGGRAQPAKLPPEVVDFRKA